MADFVADESARGATDGRGTGFFDAGVGVGAVAFTVAVGAAVVLVVGVRRVVARVPGFGFVAVGVFGGEVVVVAGVAAGGVRKLGL